MPNDQLKEYILESRKHTKTDHQIKEELIQAGWDKNIVEEGFEAIDNSEFSIFTKDPINETHTINSESQATKDFPKTESVSTNIPISEMKPVLPSEPEIIHSQTTSQDPIIKTNISQTGINYGNDLLRASELLKHSINLYKKVIWRVLAILITPMIPAFFIGIIVGFVGINSLGVGWILIGIFYLLSIIIGLWSQLSVFYLISRYEENPSYIESFKNSKRYILRYLGLNIIIFGLFTLLMLLLFIPAIAFVIPMTFTIFILIEEDISGINNVLKAKAYVKGMWWKIFGKFLYMLLVFYGILIPMAVIQYLGVNYNNAILSIIGNIIIPLIIFPLFPIGFFYLNQVYENVKAINPLTNWEPNKSTRTAWIIMSIIGILIFPIFFIGPLLLTINPAQYLEESQNINNQILQNKQLEDDVLEDVDINMPKPSLDIAPSPTPTPSPILTPTPSPTPTPPQNSNFTSFGSQSIGSDVYVNLTNVSFSDNKFTCSVTYINNGSTSQKFNSSNIYMLGNEYGTGSTEPIYEIQLTPGQSKTVSLTFIKYEEPPFTFKITVLDKSGTVELGKYE